MSYRKRYRIYKHQVQYQAYCDIERCTNAVELNTAIKRYFASFIGEIHYGKYYGDIVYNPEIHQFELMRYTFNYSNNINVPYDYIQSLYLEMIHNWLPNGYYKYRQKRKENHNARN